MARKKARSSYTIVPQRTLRAFFKTIKEGTNVKICTSFKKVMTSKCASVAKFIKPFDKEV